MLVREINLNNRGVLYQVVSQDFMSAYNNNGHSVEIALHQVSELRGVDKERLRTTLRHKIEQLKNKAA